MGQKEGRLVIRREGEARMKEAGARRWEVELDCRKVELGEKKMR